MKHDTFELLATIKKLENGRNRTMLGLVVVVGLAGFFLTGDLTLSERCIYGILAGLGALNFHEARSTRIDVFRSSLRNVLIAQDPSIVHSDEW